MAPGWIPLVLERDFESSKARREKTDIERSPGSHLPNDGGELDLGELPASMENFSCSVLTFPKERFSAG